MHARAVSAGAQPQGSRGHPRWSADVIITFPDVRCSPRRIQQVFLSLSKEERQKLGRRGAQATGRPAAQERSQTSTIVLQELGLVMIDRRHDLRPGVN
jgi:hypothetical protein